MRERKEMSLRKISYFVLLGEPPRSKPLFKPPGTGTFQEGAWYYFFQVFFEPVGTVFTGQVGHGSAGNSRPETIGLGVCPGSHVTSI